MNPARHRRQDGSPLCTYDLRHRRENRCNAPSQELERANPCNLRKQNRVQSARHLCLKASKHLREGPPVPVRCLFQDVPCPARSQEDFAPAERKRKASQQRPISAVSRGMSLVTRRLARPACGLPARTRRPTDRLEGTQQPRAAYRSAEQRRARSRLRASKIPAMFAARKSQKSQATISRLSEQSTRRVVQSILVVT